MHSIILTKLNTENCRYAKKRAYQKMIRPFLQLCLICYSTVTDFAKLRGWSTLQQRITAI